MEKLYIVSKSKACDSDCDSDHVLLIPKSRLKVKKVGISLSHSALSKSNPWQLYSASDKQIQGIRSDRQSALRIMDGGS